MKPKNQTRPYILLVLLLIFCFSSLNAQISWEETYDIGRPGAIISYSTGGFYVANRPDSVDGYVMLSRVSSLGDLLWERTYDFWEDELVLEIQELRDGDLLISGEAKVGFDTRVFLIRTDNRGDTLWTRISDMDANQYYGAVIENDSDQIIVAGRNYLTMPTPGHSFIDIIDRDGNRVDTVNLSPHVVDLEDIVYSSTGQVISIGESGTDKIISWHTNTGEWISSSTYPLMPGYSHLIHELVETSDGSFIIYGRYPALPDSMSVFMIKLDSAGVFQWEKSYERSPMVMYGEVKPTSYGGLVFVGAKYESVGTYLDAFIVRVDSNGEIVWRDQRGDSDETESYRGLTTCSDGGFAALGKNDSTWIVKYDSLGIVSRGHLKGQGFPSFQVIPNPANNHISLDHMHLTGIASVQVLTIEGSLLLETDASPSGKTEIDLHEMSPGLYFVRINDHQGVSLLQKLLISR